MTDPVTPLTPQQAAKAKAQVESEGWLHRSLVAIDQACNVIFFRGQPDETISAHAARAALEGKTWGKLMIKFLNLFSRDHGAQAMAGDEQRAENIDRIEKEAK